MCLQYSTALHDSVDIKFCRFRKREPLQYYKNDFNTEHVYHIRFTIMLEEKKEEVRAARTELRRVHKELEELNLAFDRIVLAPDVYGVSHAVALRGDVWTHKAEAHAHIFVEMWLAPGDYRLHSGVNPAVAMTVQWHPSSPMVDPAAREVLQGAGKGYPLKGMLHTARGEPVVWFEVWFLGELSECEWRIAVNADVCVGNLTVKKNWVWE